jgi:RHS repeat-associated protein
MWMWFDDPFGTNLPNSNPQGAGGFTYNLRFPGQLFDGQVGLHYNYARNYDPAVGRYIESDPIGLRGGINTYAYAGDNAMSRIDPQGLAFTYSQTGDTVTINATISIYGPNASQGLAQSWQSGINNYWNQGAQNFSFGKCKVAFNVKVNASPNSNWWFTAPSADNYIYVASPPYRSWVSGNVDWYGRWAANAPGWEAAHEAGHLFDLPDDYTDANGPNPGHAGHMMAERDMPVAPHEIADILKRIKCQCGQ